MPRCWPAMRHQGAASCAPWPSVIQPLQQLQALRMSVANMPALGELLLAGALKRDKYLAGKGLHYHQCARY